MPGPELVEPATTRPRDVDPTVWGWHVAVHERRDPTARAALVAEYTPNIKALARRLRRHGEPLDDLVQVAFEALLGAIDRFDPDRGLPFVAFLTPTIVGTIKRHYRDQGYSIRIPRRLQELSAEVRHAAELLAIDLGRPPTIDELADFTGASVTSIREAQLAVEARRTTSVDTPVEEGGFDLGVDEHGFDRVVAVAELGSALELLTPRQRDAVRLYYDEQLTQAQIGDRLGCSQMQVSRILAGAVASLRRELAPEPV